MKAESLDPEALLVALKAGEFYSIQGPRLLDVIVSPEEIVVSSSPVHAIALLTGTSRTNSKVGRNIVSVTFDLTNARKQAWVDPGAAVWFRVVAIDAAGRRA